MKRKASEAKGSQEKSSLEQLASEIMGRYHLSLREYKEDLPLAYCVTGNQDSNFSVLYRRSKLASEEEASAESLIVTITPLTITTSVVYSDKTIPLLSVEMLLPYEQADEIMTDLTTSNHIIAQRLCRDWELIDRKAQRTGKAYPFPNGYGISTSSDDIGSVSSFIYENIIKNQQL